MTGAGAVAGQLLDRLRANAAAAERHGVHDDRSESLLREGGVYALLVPERHGGAGAGLGEFARVVAELARACPASATAVAELVAGSARVAAVFPDDVQAELFAGGQGRIAMTAAGGATLTARRASGGWTLAGAVETGPAARHATHAIARASTGDAPPGELLVIVAARGHVGDAGDAGDAVLVLDGAHVADRLAVPGPGEPDPWAAATLGVAFAAVLEGAARDVVERYDEIIRDGDRTGDLDSQRWLGAALAHTGTAELLLSEAIAQAGDGTPAAPVRLGLLARESMRLSWGAVGFVLRTAGALPAGERGALERIGRAALRALHHPALPAEESLARTLARERLGIAHGA